MSMAIPECLFEKSACGDEIAYTKLLEMMTHNRRCGHYSQYSCPHQPCCTEHATDQQIDALNDRLIKDLKDVKPRWKEEKLE